MHISLLLIPGVMGSSVLGMLDVLTTARFLLSATQGSLSIQCVAVSETPVMAFQGIALTPEATIAEVSTTDLVLLPSVALDTRNWFNGQETTIAWLRTQAMAGARVASVCTGAFLLAETGLLDGRTATTHWAYASHFRQRYPAVTLQPDAILLQHGPFITAGAGMAWQDLVLQIMQGVATEDVLLQLRQMFLLQPHQHGQKPYLGPTSANHTDQRIADAQALMKKCLADEAVIQQAIHRSGLHPRTFQRRFHQATGTSAMQYLQQLRIEAAKTALIEGTLPVETVGIQAGFHDNSFFRRVFLRHTGISPSVFRKQFQTTSMNRR